MVFNGAVLYQKRLAANMSRADLAMAVRRLSQGTIKATERGIRGWEKGEYVPGGETLPVLAVAVSCEVGDLFNGNGSTEEGSLEEESEVAAQLLAAVKALVRLQSGSKAVA